MSSFAGVSVVTGGKLCTTSAVPVGTDSGYHLFVVKDYSLTVQEIPNGDFISTDPFMVGGHKWRICYCPNGQEPSGADFISFLLCRADNDEEMEEAVEAKFEFSFVDQVEYQKPLYIRTTKTYSYSVEDGCWGYGEFMRRDTLERSGNLKDDCFTIRCDIMVCKDLDTHDANCALSEIHEHFDHLLQHKVGADVTFEVSGETFAAHRCVLAARSKVFMALLFGPMAEGSTSSVIQIKDMEAEVFALLLSFIYTDSCPGMEEEEFCIERNVMWTQNVLVAADRYDLQRLKFICERLLSEHIDVSSVASNLALSEQHHCQMLNEACLKFIEALSPECLEKVMATDDWEHMIMAHPSVLNKFIVKVVSNQK
ncbi:unnamed protein product [Alopecurus aequalis]